jgi:hypothetical protein
VHTKSKKGRAARRIIALLRHNQFARATRLANIKGVADAMLDTLDALPGLLKEQGVVEETTMRRLYGYWVTPTRESMSTTATPDMVKK